MGLVLLCLATVGLMAVFHEKLRLPGAFCPAAAVCAQILTLYVLALAGLLRWGVGLVAAGGLAGLAWTLLRRREGLKALLSPGVVCFCVYAAVLWLLNAGTTPDGYDNYSHWALAAKELYLTHALPVPDTLVTMTNYPPAASLYQYLILRLAGFSEGAMLGANGILMGAFLTCGFGACGWKDRTRWPVCAGLTAALTLVIPNCGVNLQVDGLLGAMGLALGLLALWDDKRTLPVQGLLAAVLVLTKMSGVMLLALHLLLLLGLWRVRRRSVKDLGRGLLWCGVLPGGAYGLFSLRIHRVFAEALARNQFQVGADSLREKLAAKSPDFWASFPGDFWHAVWSSETPASVFFLVGNALLAVLLALYLLNLLRPRKAGAGLILFSWLALGLYTAGLAGMYIFMMDEGESIILASFYRYFGTGVLYQLGLCAFGLPMVTEGDGRRAIPGLLCLAALIWPCTRALAPGSDWEQQCRAARDSLRSTVMAVRDTVSERWDGETMLYCAGDQTFLNEDYVYRFVRYAFYSGRVRPMGPGLTQSADLAPGGRCEILWLSGDTWAAQTLLDAGLDPPEDMGLYEKDGAQGITPLWEPDER